MPDTQHPLAVVTGASTGIGLELAKCCASEGFDLLIVADGPSIEEAGEEIRRFAGVVNSVEADLSTKEGVDKLCDAIEARQKPVYALLANAGRGLGKSLSRSRFRRGTTCHRHQHHRDPLAHS
jgi:short-subunit dehydrogenase